MIRFFDFMFSLLGILFLWPVGLILYVIGLFDTGSPIFKQERVGRYKKPFKLYKFRTMHVNAAQVATHLSDASTITKFGSFLRRTKLDELPQLVNVLLGDMSLVGPRPEVRHYVNYWTPDQMHVLDVRPGITDPASIKFRNENEMMEKAENPEGYYINVIMQDKIRLYLEYVKNASFLYDLKLIFKTFKVIVTER